MIEIGFIVAVRYSPTVISFISSTTMKLVLLAFVRAYTAWVAAGDLRAQALVGDLGATGTRVTGDRALVPDAALPAVTRKLIQVNGVDCE